MSRKKQQQVEDVPVDKMDVFLAENYKKLLMGVAAILVVFLVGYAFTKMQSSKDEVLVNKVGQLETIFLLSGTDESLQNYLVMADDYPKAGDYINLKAAEVLIADKKTDKAAAPLLTAGGELKELADSLAFDTGIKDVDANAYLSDGKMSALWYYRAYLTAPEEKKADIKGIFKEKYPNSELLRQIERWDG